MNAIRKIFMPLLIIPFGMFTYIFSHPDWQFENPGFESLFVVIGIPILILNFIAWFYPQIITAYIPARDDWGGKLIAFAIVISTLIAFACVGIGAVSAIAINRRTDLNLSSPTLQPATATAVARAIDLLASPTPVEEAAIISTPTVSSQADPVPEQTPQIPVSGGAVFSSPTQLTSVTPAEATSTSVSTASTSTGTGTSSAGLCTPASANYQDTSRKQCKTPTPTR